MTDLEDYKHQYEVRLRFSDFDMMGHVNNARFLTFVEDARINYLENAVKQPLTDVEYASIVAHIDIDYKAPIMPYDRVVIYSRNVKTGSKSITLNSRVVCFPEGKSDNPEVAAECNTVLVTVNKQTYRPVEHPEEMLEGLKQMES